MVPRADVLITALGLGMLDGAGATAAEAGALPSAPSPIAIAAILNFIKCNSPLLSCVFPASNRERLPAAHHKRVAKRERSRQADVPDLEEMQRG